MSKTKTDYSCGVVAFRVLDGVREFLLVQHQAGHWAFPKGHPEDDETPIETARRELREETGLVDIELLEAPAFEEAYCFTKKSGTVVEKTVTYYLGRLSDPGSAQVTVQEEEVQAFAWGDAEATMSKLTFAEGRRLFDEVLGFLDRQPDVFRS
ncbi:MAG: NUDIX domain-containing protein [Planctomycetota bacterium]